MAKYIKQEMADLNGEGKTKAYYRMKTIRNIGMKEFIKMMNRYGGLSEGTAIAALTQASDTLAELMGMGYTVSIDGFGGGQMQRTDGNNQPNNDGQMQPQGQNAIPSSAWISMGISILVLALGIAFAFTFKRRK